MTPFPYCVQAEDSLLYAREIMVRHEIRHLPVKKGHTLVGVLSDRDLKRALDPDLGLPPKEELFVDDVFEPQAYIVDAASPSTACWSIWRSSTSAAPSSRGTAISLGSSRRWTPAACSASTCERFSRQSTVTT